jgi:hypothetical protein
MLPFFFLDKKEPKNQDFVRKLKRIYIIFKSIAPGALFLKLLKT